jgi:hypothetical protein
MSSARWDRRETSMTALRLLTALAILAAACVAFAQPRALEGEVRIVPSPVGAGPEETTYEVRSGACRIRWIVARSGVNQGIAQHRAACSLPLTEQIALNARILEKVLESEPTFRTLFLGRLTPFPELSVRLAAAARHSAEWDARRGRPRSSTPTAAYLLEIFASGEPAVFAEWKRLFEDRRLAFAVSGVEKVSVGAAGALPYFSELTARGVTADDRVPFDCLVWFSATRLP